MIGSEASHHMLPEPLPPDPPYLPPAKRLRSTLPTISSPTRPQMLTTCLPDDLGKLIEEDAKSFLSLGWEKFVNNKRGRGNFNKLRNLRHPAKRILQQYSARGVPVVLHSAPWSPDRIHQALQRGPHKLI